MSLKITHRCHPLGVSQVTFSQKIYQNIIRLWWTCLCRNFGNNLYHPVTILQYHNDRDAVACTKLWFNPWKVGSVLLKNNIYIYSFSLHQHCWYWFPGALAPMLQQPWNWLWTHAFPTVYGLNRSLLFRVRKKALFNKFDIWEDKPFTKWA